MNILKPLFLAAILLLPNLPLLAATNATSLVQERLDYMKSVAAYKWQHNMPIEDLKREQVVLGAAGQQGLRHGLKPGSSRLFFQLQIDAAKEIQQYWFDSWSNHRSTLPIDVPDLDNDIRPVLITLGNQITEALGNPAIASQGEIEVIGLSDESAQKLIFAISNVERYATRLEQILFTGRLVVGTTGDYAPFSISNAPGENNPFRGIDIDLAQNLAQSLNVELEWYHTSWPTLMQDLEDRKFDIGMSGISRSLERQQSAYFSVPYHSGGKTPIVRCTDRDKFKTLADIDQPSTRIIVNPGGTNNRFVTENIGKANVRVFEDNRLIFDEIASGSADVMITDQIEVTLQINSNPTLCAAIPGETFTYSEKGYLLPQDITFKEYVDLWLSLRIEDDTVNRLFEEHLNL